MLAGKERKEKCVANLRKPEAECTVCRARGVYDRHTEQTFPSLLSVCAFQGMHLSASFLAETKWFVRM